MNRKNEKYSFHQLFLDFLQHSYTNGLSLLLLSTPVRYAKTLWIITLTIVVISTHVVIYNLTLEYIGQPTEIHMSPNLVHVANSPFPAVAVCSANKISKRKLRGYASKIFVYHQDNHQPAFKRVAQNVDELSQKLLVLANYFMNAFDEPQLNSTELELLHDILSNYYNTTMYPIRNILRELAPDCDRLILRGIVYGEPVNTSSLFMQRMTSSSVCCIFNYRRPSYSQDLDIQNKRDLDLATTTTTTSEVQFESNSILNSVQFVLQDDPFDEYTYTFLTNSAFQLYIFPQHDYATIQSNSLGEILVDHNTIVEIPIQPDFFESSQNIKQTTPEKRLCYFPEEGTILLNQSYYSLDECLLLCRIESMLQYCGCVSSTMATNAQQGPICTLLDLPCLMKWKRIWYDFDEFFYVGALNDEDIAKETHTFELCHHCLPTCNGVNFKIFTSILPLGPSQNIRGYSHGLLKGLTNEYPVAIIKLFFKQRYAQATESQLVGDWVVLLNRFGGILSLMYGFSIISYIEICYYLTGKWFIYIYRIWIQNHHHHHQHQPPPPSQRIESLDRVVANENITLYWRELKYSIKLTDVNKTNHHSMMIT